MNKRYRLLHNLPNVGAGEILKLSNRGTNYCCKGKDGHVASIRKGVVENNPEWFELIPEQKDQPKGEGVKALNISFESNTNLLKVFINKPINEVVAETGIDKLLERLTIALNNDTEVDDKVTMEELLKAESDAFYAGRAGYRIQIPHNGMEYGDFNYHHKTFSDYKDSQNKKQQTTMAINRQDTDFAEVMKDSIDEVKMSNTSLDNAIEWIQSQLEPDDVFTEDQLISWAESNGFVKE